MKRGDSGMTLMELLIVISILGLLVTVMLPFSGRMSDNNKREETIQLLESIRYGLLGPDNAYDANGNRVLGGYVGDYGTLPDFVLHHWDTTTNSWVIAKEGSSDDPQVLNLDNIAEDNYDANIMPLGLWTNIIRVHNVTDPHEFMDHKDWNGPYVVPPRDDFTSDDDLYTYTRSAIPTTSEPNVSGGLDPDGAHYTDEERHFLLRQGTGRLTDGWGSALMIYFDTRDNLYFVSAGSDRRISFGDSTKPLGDPDDDLGPADPSLPNNDDNLVLMISKAQWSLDDQKIAMTKQKLKDIRTAIVGQRGQVTDGISQPNGFVADMGSIELLTGSYVYVASVDTIYRCTSGHTSVGAAFPGAGSEWQEVPSTDPNDDYPYVPEWVSGRQYHEARPALVMMNAAYVKVDVSGGATPEYEYYRYVYDTPAMNKTPDATSAYWVEDDTFAGQDWVPDYDGSTEYSKNMKTPWRYFQNVGFGAGWRGPYTSSGTTSLSDEWGNEITMTPDDQGMEIRSSGPDKTADTVDDIVEYISRSEYEVPGKVIVEDITAVTSTTALAFKANDYVSMYTVFNGDVASFNVPIVWPLTGVNGEFLFNKTGRATMTPQILADPATAPSLSDPVTISDSDTLWLPVGRVTAVFRQETATTSVYKTPDTVTSGERYYKTFVIHPRTSPDLTLGD